MTNVTKDDHDGLADQFEAQRAHLRAMAYRMLGSLDEADDAVQETWLRFSRSETEGLENLRGWLTVVVARICLDMLRSRKARREDPIDGDRPKPLAGRDPRAEPEPAALLADSVGIALLVVLDTLAPAERIAFVLHDIFAVPFEEIAPIVGRSTTAARQLASRARRRVQGAEAVHTIDFPRQREIVEAFLAASRRGDFEALLAMLDPDVVVRPDPAVFPLDKWPEIHGATAVARQALRFVRHTRFAQPALVNGAVGIVVAPHGRLLLVLTFTHRRGKIVAIDVIAAPERLRQLDLAVIEDGR